MWCVRNVYWKICHKQKESWPIKTQKGELEKGEDLKKKKEIKVK
jgi:hypothetical protein